MLSLSFTGLRVCMATHTLQQNSYVFMYTCLLFPDLITVLCDLGCLLPYLALSSHLSCLENVWPPHSLCISRSCTATHTLLPTCVNSPQPMQGPYRAQPLSEMSISFAMQFDGLVMVHTHYMTIHLCLSLCHSYAGTSQNQ